MKTHQGVYYFPTRQAASEYALSIGAPTDRILWFERGYAIQWHKSGAYVGPNDLTHAGCRWCKP